METEFSTASTEVVNFHMQIALAIDSRGRNITFTGAAMLQRREQTRSYLRGSGSMIQTHPQGRVRESSQRKSSQARQDAGCRAIAPNEFFERTYSRGVQRKRATPVETEQRREYRTLDPGPNRVFANRKMRAVTRKGARPSLLWCPFNC